MVKIGIFVEGQTERIFVVRFLSEFLGGEHKFSRIERKNLGSKGTILLTKRDFPKAKYYILIFDSAGDGNVIPTLRDRAENMVNKEGYHYLLAVEDLYDRPKNKKKKVEQSFVNAVSHFSFRDKLSFILAIMEIEAWFIADYNIFCRIGKIATPEFIKNKLNIDLINQNPESHRHPSEIVNKIYNLFGQQYKKTEKQSYEIVNNIDYNFLYSDEIIKKVKSWGYFVNCINKSLFSQN